jgi:phage-related tail fiber protein
MSGELRVNRITDEAGTGSPNFPQGINAANLVGQVVFVAMTTAPSGYLKANGAAVSRSTFSDLFTAIGTTYGAGDGSTTFNLPDLRGEFLRGWDDGRGVDSGRSFGTAQADAFQNHGHQMQFSSAGPVDQWSVDSNAGTSFGRGANGGGNNYGTMNIRGPKEEGGAGTPRTASETRPRNVALLACIKF